MKKKVPIKAFILAAGLGTRLGRVTETLPKCLIPINGRPMLAYQLEKIRDFGVTQVCINLHHKAELVREYISSNPVEGLEIAFSHESELLDTGGALKKAAWFFDATDNFFLLNADILTDAPLTALTVECTNSIAVFATLKRDEPRRLLLDTQKRVLSVGEFSPPYPENSRAFAAIALYSAEIITYACKERREVFSVKDLWKAAIQDGKNILACDIPERSYWFDIGTENSLQEARNFLATISL